MAEVTKGEFITNILATQTNIVAWKMFRTGTSALAVAVNEAWESSNNVTLDSPFVQGLINALVPAVLGQDALDRLNAEVAVQGGMTNVSNLKRYLVTIPESTENHFIYCSNYATADISVSGKTGNTCIVEAKPNTFNCPTAVEVV